MFLDRPVHTIVVIVGAVMTFHGGGGKERRGHEPFMVDVVSAAKSAALSDAA
jgi:hypothetical protein